MKIVAAGLVAFVGVYVGAQTPLSTQAPAETPPATFSAADGIKRFTGIWTLNHDLSTGLPSADGSSGGQPGGGPPGAGGQGGSGGRGGGGRGGGSRGGGGFGGFGGFGGGGRGGGGGVSSEDTLKMHAVTRELGEPPETMTVIASAQTVSFTASDGVVRKFSTNDKKEKLDLTTAQIDVKSKWNGAVIEQELTAASLKLKRSYTVSNDGHQLIVDVGPQTSGSSSSAGSAPPSGRGGSGGRPGGVRPMHLVYERTGFPADDSSNLCIDEIYFTSNGTA